MARLTLFQVAVMWHPDLNNEDEEKMDSKLIVEPYTVLEKDEKILAFKVVRALDEKWMDKLNQIEIIIRPF